jgi:hypothetical protein
MFRPWPARSSADVGLDVVAELLGRHRPGLDRFAGQLLGQVGRLEHRHLRLVQALDDVGRQAGGADRAVPLHGVEALEADFLHGGHVLELRAALLAGDGQRAHAARAQVRQRGGQAGEHGLGLAAQHVVDGRCDAAVGDVQHEGAGLLLEQLHRQVRQRAGAGRAVAHPAGVLLHVVDELP